MIIFNFAKTLGASLCFVTFWLSWKLDSEANVVILAYFITVCYHGFSSCLLDIYYLLGKNKSIFGALFFHHYREIVTVYIPILDIRRVRSET